MSIDEDEGRAIVVESVSVATLLIRVEIYSTILRIMISHYCAIYERRDIPCE